MTVADCGGKGKEALHQVGSCRVNQNNLLLHYKSTIAKGWARGFSLSEIKDSSAKDHKWNQGTAPSRRV